MDLLSSYDEALQDAKKNAPAKISFIDMKTGNVIFESISIDRASIGDSVSVMDADTGQNIGTLQSIAYEQSSNGNVYQQNIQGSFQLDMSQLSAEVINRILGVDDDESP